LSVTGRVNPAIVKLSSPVAPTTFAR
jgi:hypothetical protein